MGTNEEDAIEFLQETTDVAFSVDTEQKPDISKLPDALDKNGKPVFAAGDKIVIESYINFVKRRKYLHTRVYLVKSIDEISGDVKLFDEGYKQSAYTNIYNITKTGDVVKIHFKMNQK